MAGCVCVCMCAGVLIIMCAHTLFFPHNYTPTAQQSEDYYGRSLVCYGTLTRTMHNHT